MLGLKLGSVIPDEAVAGGSLKAGKKALLARLGRLSSALAAGKGAVTLADVEPLVVFLAWMPKEQQSEVVKLVEAVVAARATIGAAASVKSKPASYSKGAGGGGARASGSGASSSKAGGASRGVFG